MNNFCAGDVLERMKNLYEVNTFKELAEALNLGSSTVSGWNVKNSIPFEVLLSVAEEKQISLDFLIYGKSAGQALSTHEKMALIAFNELSDRQKIQALAMMGNLAANGLIPPSVQLNQIGGTHNRQHVGDE